MLSGIFAVSPEWSAQFLLVLARVSAAVVAMPMLGARGAPSQAKIGLSLLLALIVLPLHAKPSGAADANIFVFASNVGIEALVGLCFGILTSLVFHALQMGASMVGTQIGFGLSELFDPLTGAQTETMTQFYGLLVTLVFFAINGHHIAILGLLRTFEVVPPGTADISLIAGDRFILFVGALFGFAFRVALPVVGALLLTDLALGLVARTVPQMNILVEGFPVKIAVGVLVLAASLPLLTAFMASVFRAMLPQVAPLLVVP